MLEGVIKTVRLDKGYGFITVPSQPDVFFHCTMLHESLPFDETLQERRVKFDTSHSDRGPKAVNVRAAD